jgi:thiamine-phosphate pyrophosphorylase
MMQALAAGVRLFQYRDKHGSRKSIWKTALLLAKIARRTGALLIVNDYADIALAVDADGVHLGQDDLPVEEARKIIGREKLIGISTHNTEQARDAEQSGADYIGFGPIYPTATKDAGAAQGLENLRTIRQTVSIPIIAIGGINESNAGDIVRAGADGVAVISAILTADDMKQKALDMVLIVSKARSQHQEIGGAR